MTVIRKPSAIKRNFLLALMTTSTHQSAVDDIHPCPKRALSWWSTVNKKLSSLSGFCASAIEIFPTDHPVQKNEFQNGALMIFKAPE